MVRRSSGGWRTATAVVIVALVAGLGLALVPPAPVGAQSTPPPPVPGPFLVTLTAGGFVPDRITVVPGQTIEIVNGSGATRRIDSGGDGTFDAGPVAPDSRVVLALPTTGTWRAVDDATPTPHEATITVGLQVLPGEGTAPATSAIPDLDAPLAPVVVHPDLAIEVTRNRLVVGFSPSATVDQANAALTAAGLTIVGGNRDAQVLVVEVPDAGTPGLEYMQAALEVLRAQPGVRTAAYDITLNTDASLPRPANPDPLPGPGGERRYTWDAFVTDDETIRGNGLNYGLESARFPQAWNWLDALESAQPINRASSATIVLDDGFDVSHPDLAGATLHRLCTTGGRCTDNLTGFDVDGESFSEHGTATAGVVGAVFDRGPNSSPTSQGTVGGDPASDLHLVPYFDDSPDDATGTVQLVSFSSVLDLILDEKTRAPFTFSHLRVINLSAGVAFTRGAGGKPLFELQFGTRLCGPGANDDATTPVADKVACTPNSYDPYLTEFRAAAELMRPLADRLAANNVLLVVAAGNDSRKFCATRPRTDPSAACTDFVPISATASDFFGYLASVWTVGVPPWVVVEANTATFETLTRTGYSNVDGQISAAGAVVAPYVDSSGVPTYQIIQGTSFAAPLVSAAAGLLSARTASWQTVRSLLVDRATRDVPGTTTPRLDVFASLLGLPASTGVDALLDVNDLSPDGNRRVVYDDRGQPTGEDTQQGSAQLRTRFTAPDGRIDMRDFRRFRDLYLDFCQGLDGCPAPEQVRLDGFEYHPKKDGNLDGCFVLQFVPGCTNPEGVFSRVDFNGDGTLLEREFPTLLRPDGTPAPRGSPSRMTDLDVLETRFGQGPNADTEGWTAADLGALISSADVELRLDTLWAQGAESVEVTAGTVLRTGPRRTFTPRGPGDVRMYTVPVEPVADLGDADIIQVRVVAQLPGDGVVVYLSDVLPVKAGQDVVVTPCLDQLVLDASPPETTPGGSSLITATLQDCTGRPVVGNAVDFRIESGPNGSSISVVEATTDASGVARTVFTYPEGVNSAATVVARAYPAVDGGEPLERSIDLGPAEDFTIHYRFRQTILDYERTSTNDWGPGEDDCDGPNDAGTSPARCFTATQQIRTDWSIPGLPGPNVAPGELERRGTITPSLSGGAIVDDAVRSVQRDDGTRPEGYDIRGITLQTTVEEWDPATPGNRVTKVYDSPIEVSGQPSSDGFADLPAVDVGTIDFAVTDQGIKVNNLRQFGDLYAVRQAAYTLQRGFGILPEDTNPDLPIPNLYQPLQQIPTDLALVPRVDSSSFAWDENPDAPLEFRANGDGTYQPASWCGTRERVFDNATDPGFWDDADPAIETTNPFDPNEVFPGPYRDPDEQRAERQPGDRAAPRHSGSVRSRFEFVAVVTETGAPAPDLEFPTCTDTDSAPYFGWQPDQPVEGEEVQFLDLSSYADTAMGRVWRFGDPEGTSPTAESHRFSDNGTYGVDFTVTDAGGTDHTSDVADVKVLNAPPTLDDLQFLDGGRRIQFAVDDPGVIDRQQLEVRLTSPTPGWPSSGVVGYTAPPTDPVTGEPALGAWTDDLLLPDSLTPGVYFVVLTVQDKDGGKATRSFSLAVPVPVPDPFAGGPDPATARPAATTPGADTATAVVDDAAATSPPPSAPVPAFVVDRTSVATGQLVAVRNATRTAGLPAAADLDPGDGRPPLRLGADGAVELAYVTAGGPVLRLAAGAIGAGTTMSVTGAPVPAGVTYEGPTTAPLGADAAVVARAQQVGGTPVPGVVVQFTLGGATVQAVAGPDGRARADLPVTGALGTRDLVVQVVPDGTPTTVPFTVTANAVPVADAGGPYEVGVGSPLTFAGTGTDADPGEQATLVLEWDLDDDGAFDDATGPEPSLSADQVRTVLCRGVCDAGETAPVALRATDTKGGRSVATTTVTLVRDFGLTINPATATLVPNANVSFTVSVLSTNGFTDPVTLTAPGLPPGITATFTPPTVAPNGTSLLNVRAGATFTPADFPLLVRGTSGSLVRETGTSLSLEFGLIPQCFGAVSGRVTDETGAGVPGVGVFGAVTDADGRYAVTGLALEAGNAPRTLFVSNLGSAFYPLQPSASVLISCGVTSTLDLSVLRRQYGAVQGTITGIDVDGSPMGPIDGATYALNRRTGPDGRYSFTNLPLGPENAPTDYQVSASAPGFHSRSGIVEISAGTTSTADIALQRICTADVRVRVLDQATGRAVPGARVDAGFGSSVSGVADANGIAVLTGLGLGGPDNRPIGRTVRAFTPDGVSPQGSASANVVLGRCGAQVPVDLAVRFPRRVETPVTVTVVDDTGAPVEGATVRIGSTNYSFALTGPDGRTTVTHLFGIDVASTLNTTVTAGKSGLLSPPAIPVTLTEGVPAEVTVTLVTRKFGTVEGTVRDRATGAPVAGVVVSGVTTGPDGRYRRQNLPLNGLNEPAQTSIRATDQRNPRQYWDSANTQVTVTADGVTVVPDLLMTRVCEPATVRGRVVNAVDRTPIEGATVRITSSLVDQTDGDGRFLITGVPVGNDNTPLEWSVTASAPGFLTATKNVTVTCAADIVVDFGRDGDGVGTITGTVTDPDGNPVSQARVTTGFGGSTRTDSLGRYTIANAPAGEGGAARDWQVRVQPPTGSVLEGAEGTATVRPDETTTLDFQLGTLADDPPTAASFALVIEPGPTPITLAGADPTGDPLTFSVTAPPANGTLTGTVPNLVYTPDDGFVGVDTIEYVADDGTNQSEPGVITITVLAPNVAPTAVITGPTEADEGTRVDLSATSSSDPDGTLVTYEWDLDGDGAYDDDTGTTSDVRLRDDGVAVVGLRVTDDRGGVATTTHTVTFRNVDPTLAIDFVDVTGRTVELFGEVDDDGRDDTFTGTIDLGDGSGERPLTPDELDDGDLYVTHTYAGGGVYTITVEICDDDGGCTTETIEVTVAGPGNAPPTARITGPDEALEGSTVLLSGATSTDAEGPIAAYQWDLDGDGAFDDATGVSASLTRPDDEVVDVGLRVLDGNGLPGVRRMDVTFLNGDPVVAPIPATSVVAGGAVDLDGSFTDPGADEWSATVDWDDGAGPVPLALTGTTFALARTFAEAGAHTVVVEVCDDDGGCGTTTVDVTVTPANRPPVAVIDGPATTPEGSDAALDGGASADPDGAVVAHAWDLDDDGAFDDAATATTTLPCPDDGTRTVRLQVTDDDGDTGITTATVTCTNVAPTVAAVAGAALAPGDAFQRTGSFTDPGADTWTATVDWGEGAGPVPLALTGSGFDLDHVYGTEGTFTVTVDVCDDDGECGTATATVTVAEPPPDPEADLSIDKGHEGSFTAGGTGTYEIVVANAGPDVATDVTVVDELPTGMTLTTSSGSGWTCTGTTTVTCTLSGGLAVGQAPTLTLTVAIAGDAAIGEDALTNRASVAGSVPDPDPTDDEATDPTTIVAPTRASADRSVTASASDTEPGPGETVDVTIDVANGGPDASGPVELSVEVPAGLTFVQVVATDGADPGAGEPVDGPMAATWTCTPGAPLVCTIDDVAAGGSAPVTLRFLVAADASGVLEVVARIGGAAVDPDPTDDTASVRLTVVGAATTTTTTTATTSTTTPSSTTTDPTGGSTSSSTTSPTAGGVGSATLPPSSAAPVSGSLPRTGSDASGMATLAVALLAAGGLLVLAARRRLRRTP